MNPNTITVGNLMGLITANNIDEHATVMTDSGWECDETEVDMIFYNPKTKVLMFTREYGNALVYEESDDWKLLWKYKKE